MKTIKAVLVTSQNFAPYGTIADISSPANAYGIGESPCIFYRDMLVAPMESTAPVAFGSLKVEHRPFVIEDVEYHSHAMEGMMPLDDDVILYAGPANCGTPELDRLEAFLVPAGTMVFFRAGAWHGAPYPVHHNATVLICLPERTYLNDTCKTILKEDEQLTIEL